MHPVDEVRIDKWLWSVRVYKTRSEAAEACKKGRVKVNGMEAKPSRDVRINDIITIRKSPVVYTFRVIGSISNRQPAKLVENFAENLTPQEELDKLNANSSVVTMVREKGAGRPTKRDRRKIGELNEEDD
ncbi:RNA-binding S4 domain-containing protein [Williamwhitmania taraxaci]|uniref:Heat shock protein Hsp15 n=1 Tax=Williamwhitmania taraxaci TaxID=1640674 RepID=A0A1G6HMK6_9BACT|nr:RNA-binding S4 domain-containing protein [Williamwhitmania taraxaci]SDB95537.1 heat shock protein Hsp15 [Williamwhitmania taraxaci]